jgi:hypothetical protein
LKSTTNVDELPRHRAAERPRACGLFPRRNLSPSTTSANGPARYEADQAIGRHEQRIHVAKSVPIAARVLVSVNWAITGAERTPRESGKVRWRFRQGAAGGTDARAAGDRSSHKRGGSAARDTARAPPGRPHSSDAFDDAMRGLQQ